MRCQVCKTKEATIHLTEITDGQRSEMHVCEGCAVEQGVAVKSQMPLNELLSNLLASAPSEEDMFSAEDAQRVCPNCGFTLDQFRKEALLGCPDDYEFFAKALVPILKSAHGGQITHCGKIPSKVPKDTKKQIKLLNLRQELETVVQAEDYERAAKLRDEINQIEK